jgi:hypothetical protein
MKYLLIVVIFFVVAWATAKRIPMGDSGKVTFIEFRKWPPIIAAAVTLLIAYFTCRHK